MNRNADNITSISLIHYLMISSLRWLSIFAEIIKIKITILVSLTTALGYFLGTNELSLRVIYPVVGIFILACGSAALNQYQERKEDSLMNRTKNRPIPTGKISAFGVLIISVVLLVIGSTILIVNTNITTLLIGLLAFYWYNGVYTPLKKKIIFAIIPGSIVGALPPLAGWAATGNNIFDFNILYVALYFFIWQIPHFWLLLLIYGKDFDRGGFPVLTNKFSEKTITGITFVMSIATALIAAFLPMLSLIHYSISAYILWVFCALMITSLLRFLVSDFENKIILKTFVGINIFTLLIITLLSIDKIIYLAR